MTTSSSSEHGGARRACLRTLPLGLLWGAVALHCVAAAPARSASESAVADVGVAPNPEAGIASADGRWLLRAEPLNRTILLQDALGMQHARWPWPKRVVPAGASVRQPVHIALHPLRHSWLVAFGGTLTAWEVSHDPQAEPIFEGLVHDYRMGEGLAKPGYLNPRVTRLAQPLDDFWLDPGSPHWLGQAHWDDGALVVVNLDIRRERARLALPDPCAWARRQRADGGWLLAGPNPSQTRCLRTGDWRLQPCGALR